MKRIINLLTVLVMAVSLAGVLPAVDAAAETYSGSCGDNVTWSLDMSTGVLTISGTGDMYDYIQLGGGEGFTGYSPSWSSFNSDIQQVEIEDGVTSIGEQVFVDCENLKSIKIPSSVTIIYIGNLFDNCESLTEIIVDSNNKNYSSKDGVLFNYNKTELIQYPSEKIQTTYTIPNSVTSIGDGAFWGCESLTSITIPNSVTSIGYNAFDGTPWLENKQKENPLVIVNGILIDATTYSGEELTIPNSVTSIGDGAFWGCESLTSITIPNSLTSIGDSAFYFCESLTSVTIPDSVTSIGDRAFFGCGSLTSIKIPNSVTSIGDSAFSDTTWLGNKQKENPLVVINGILIDGSTCIGNVDIPNSVKSIEGLAFAWCESLTSVIIPNSVTSIGRWAFYRCDSLTSVTIPNSVTSIGEKAFDGCDSLTSITIPKCVTYIGKYAFGYNHIYGTHDKLDNFKIYCYADSAGEQYAINNGFDYELLICEHNYTSKITTPATCTTNGVKTYTCNMCGDKYTETIPAIGHNYQNGTCTICGEKDPNYKQSTQNPNNNPNNNSTKPNQTVSSTNNKKTNPSTTKVSVSKPTKVKSVKLTAKKKKLNVKWKKVSGATGYEVMYAKNNKFTKGKKTVKVKKNKLTLKRLKSKKKYFIKVRAYKTVNGNTSYGKWSKVANKKVK